MKGGNIVGVKIKATEDCGSEIGVWRLETEDELRRLGVNWI